MKRQAARFRVYAYHDDGTIEELTAAEADITWTAHLVNKKATHASNAPASASDLTIDPGSRTLNAPDQRALFDTGTISFSGASPVTVPLGEMRTDVDGRLLVLGGHGMSASPTNQTSLSFNSPGWYDDISDGSVAAHVKIRATGDEFDADGAWVLVAPPEVRAGVADAHDALRPAVPDGRGPELGDAAGEPVLHQRRLPDPAACPRDPLGLQGRRHP